MVVFCSWLLISSANKEIEISPTLKVVCTDRNYAASSFLKVESFTKTPDTYGCIIVACVQDVDNHHPPQRHPHHQG